MVIIIPQEKEQPIDAPHLQPLANETTFGGGPGLSAIDEQVQKIASSTNEIATFEKIRADQTAVQGATAKLAAIHADLLTNPKEGLPAYQGINAMDGHDKVMAEYQKSANELAKGLQPDQQGAFNKIAIEQGDALNQHAMAYVNSQIEQHDTNTFQAAIKNNTQLASVNYGNPDSVSTFKDQNDKIAGARAKRLGLDPDQTTDFMRTVNSQFHEAVLSQMVNDPKFQTKAQDYFNTNKGEMDTDTKERVQKFLGEGDVRTQSTQTANDIWKKTGGNLTEAFKQADGIGDLAVQEMTRARLREMQHDKVDGQEAQQNDLYQNAFKQIQAAERKGAGVDIQTAVDPATWTAMDASSREKIKKLVLNDTTDAQKYTTFSLMTPEEKKAITPDQLQQDWLPYMAPKDRNRIMSDWTKARSNNTDAQLGHDQNSLIADSAKQLGVAGLDASHDPKKLSGANAQAYHEYAMTAQDAILNFEKTKLGGARKASTEETQAILDNITMKRVGQNSIFGLKFGGRDVPALTNITPFEQIPTTDRSDLFNYSKKAGVNPSNEQIEQAYYYAQSGDITRARNILRRK